MKFTIAKAVFQDALNHVQNVVSNRATLPILSNVLIEATAGQIKLTTTDLDVGVTGSTPAEVEKEGSTTLPVKKLATIIAALPAETVEITVDSKNIASIRSGPSFFKIIGLGVDEFPPLAKFEDANEYKISQSVLLDSLKKTHYAISTDETRYVLNGIFASFKESKLTLVATDGRRLAMVENELEFPASHQRDIIIPTKAVQELQRLLSDEGDVVLKLTQNQIAFEANGNLLVSKLIEGNYPNYRQVIPSAPAERIKIDRASFLQTVRRVALLATDASNSVKLIFGENNIDVTANAQDVGEAKESVAVSYTGPQFAIAFNPEFLMAPLKNLPEEEIYLDLIDEMSPGVIRIDGTFLYVIMPMRVTN
ncbi:DNA polymerase III subunit beta [Akkermansiaceae bacterium]|nr:DNA polymerase III subunit beta [Akkermansiaceae bacterium]